MNNLAEFALNTPPKLITGPIPQPGPGQALVRIHACALNFADLLMIEGRYQDMPALPFTLGMEVAGTVEAIGPGVTEVAFGDRVAYAGGPPGAYADERLLPADTRILAEARGVDIADRRRLYEAEGWQGFEHDALHGARPPR